VKKAIFLSVFAILLIAGTLVAQSTSRNYISNYNIMDLDFLRSHYTEINDGRPIQIEGDFSSYKWLSPYEYKERMESIGFDSRNFNLIQMTLKEKDDFHFSFPILLFHTGSGDLHELDRLFKGARVTLFCKFHHLKKSEYALEVDVMEVANVSTHVDAVGTETLKMGGHDRIVLLDGRISPTSTPTPTVTPTPKPNLWQKISNVINPKETTTPSETVTPGT
jgi:hypothetical protein